MTNSHKDTKLTRPTGCTSPSSATVSSSAGGCAANPLSVTDKKRALPQDLMERMCSRENLNSAFRRVKSNAGTAGVDRMSVNDLYQWLVTNKEGLIANLLKGSYRPVAVLGVEIPKPGGGKRLLGISTVVDRLVQQAMSQILTPILEPSFSDSNFGVVAKRQKRGGIPEACSFRAE